MCELRVGLSRTIRRGGKENVCGKMASNNRPYEFEAGDTMTLSTPKAEEVEPRAISVRAKEKK